MSRGTRAKTEAPDTPVLPCGCHRGYFLCPDAERLWRLTETVDWVTDGVSYDQMRAAYDAHFER